MGRYKMKTKLEYCGPILHTVLCRPGIRDVNGVNKMDVNYLIKTRNQKTKLRLKSICLLSNFNKQITYNVH